MTFKKPPRKHYSKVKRTSGDERPDYPDWAEREMNQRPYKRSNGNNSHKYRRHKNKIADMV